MTKIAVPTSGRHTVRPVSVRTTCPVYKNDGRPGLNTVVTVAHPQVSGGLNLSYGSGGTYADWDRFGRIAQQLWKNDSGTTLDGYTYTYDRAGNRISRTNVLNSSLSETYSYDGLNRLVDANRNGTDLQNWGLDALGNWSSNTTSSGTQTRTSDAANEITAISGSWAQPTYDAAGNMTTIPAAGDESISLRLTYDAWNHVVEVMRNMAPPPYEGWVTFATYSYDGLGRLVNTGEMPGQIEFYYNENYQIIEHRFIVNGGPYKETTQYVWDQRYIDAPAMAFMLEEVQGQQPVLTKYYFAEDANFDVTLRVKEDGTITGRAVYTPYGQRTVLSSTWGTGSYSIGDLGHQGLMLMNDTGATGMYYNRARFYHPTLGTYVQRDPLGYVDGDNPYAYEQNSPSSRLDSMGTDSEEDKDKREPPPKPVPPGETVELDLRVKMDLEDLAKALGKELDSVAANRCMDITVKSVRNATVSLTVEGDTVGAIRDKIKEKTGVDIGSADVAAQLAKMAKDKVVNQSYKTTCKKGDCCNKKAYKGTYEIDASIEVDINLTSFGGIGIPGIEIGPKITATFKGSAELSGWIGECK